MRNRGKFKFKCKKIGSQGVRAYLIAEFYSLPEKCGISLLAVILRPPTILEKELRKNALIDGSWVTF